MQKMTAGLLFWNNAVLLVKKNHPTWQSGLLNAIGGKIEQTETPPECMNREFVEEVGIGGLEWDLFAIETGTGEDKYMVYFYRARIESRSLALSVPPSNDVQETLHWTQCSDLPAMRAVVGNLRWLVPMAQDWRRLVAKIETTDDIRTRAAW